MQSKLSSVVKYIWNNSYLNSAGRCKWRIIIAVNFRESPDFFRLSYNCLNWKINCDDHSPLANFQVLIYCFIKQISPNLVAKGNIEQLCMEWCSGHVLDENRTEILEFQIELKCEQWTFLEIHHRLKVNSWKHETGSRTDWTVNKGKKNASLIDILV